MKKRNVFSLFSVAALSLLILAGCATTTMTTDQLAVQFGDNKVYTEKAGKLTNIGGNFTVKLINRSTTGMDVAFMEGALIDANTNKALIRFRPIIPDAYGGSLSTITLIPGEKKDVPVVMPLGQEAFDITQSPKVLVKFSFQTTRGYRTDAVSSAVVITQK
jgi:hypothetical protein